jgi:hypothetical protein
MANRYAVATGNWSSLATWDGGASLPGAGDTVRPNGFTVTIDQNITVTELRNNASAPASSGGSFNLAVGWTITANIIGSGAGTPCVAYSGSGGTRYIVGNITGDTGYAVTTSSQDLLVITGNITCTNNYKALYGPSSINASITGNLTAGTTSGGNAIDCAGTNNLAVTGSVTSSVNNAAINATGAGTISINGTVTASSAFAGIVSSSSSCTIIANGDLVAGGNGKQPLYVNGPLWISASATISHAYPRNNAGIAGALRYLYTGGVNLGQPVVANVRSGTVYGASSEYTGTLAVPSASLVALGVSTDNTTGTYNPQPALLIDTTIAVRTSETVFTLTAGSTDDSAYVGQTVIVTKNGSTTRKEIGTVSAYVGSTKQITLSSDPGVMTIAAGDAICIFAGSSSGGGGGGLDAAGVRAAVGLASANLDAQLSDISTKTANLPSDPADQSIIVAATAAILTAVDGVQSDTNDIQTRIPVALDGGRIAAVLDSTATAALVDLIWDEPLTGATHNVATSSGKRLRQTTAFQQIDSTVIDASATTTTFVTGLTSSVDNFYNDSMLVFTDGALAGQVRAIYDYIGATKTIVLAEALTSAPVNGVAFAIVSLHIHPVSQIQSGLATSAALATESTKISRIEAVATGTVTGAGTSTEVFVGPSATLTITVDSSGNRSAVVVT